MFWWIRDILVSLFVHDLRVAVAHLGGEGEEEEQEQGEEEEEGITDSFAAAAHSLLGHCLVALARSLARSVAVVPSPRLGLSFVGGLRFSRALKRKLPPLPPLPSPPPHPPPPSPQPASQPVDPPTPYQATFPAVAAAVCLVALPSVSLSLSCTVCCMAKASVFIGCQCFPQQCSIRKSILIDTTLGYFVCVHNVNLISKCHFSSKLGHGAQRSVVECS